MRWLGRGRPRTRFLRFNQLTILTSDAAMKIKHFLARTSFFSPAANIKLPNTDLPDLAQSKTSSCFSTSESPRTVPRSYLGHSETAFTLTIGYAVIRVCQISVSVSVSQLLAQTPYRTAKNGNKSLCEWIASAWRGLTPFTGLHGVFATTELCSGGVDMILHFSASSR